MISLATSLRQTRILSSLLLAASLFCADAVWSAQRANAEDIQLTGPLAGAPAVHHLRVWRKNRLQLQPFFAFTLQNEFSRTLFIGVEAKYHFTDWLGLGVYTGFGMAKIDTNLTGQVEKKGVTTNRNRLSLPSRQGFDKQVGRMNWLTGIDVSFVPLRGKLALFQKIFVDTDLQFFGGLAFVGVEERADVTTAVCDAFDPAFGDGSACLATQSASSKRVAVAPSFGIGINAHFKQFMGISIQWRGLPFKWNTSGTDQAGDPRGRFPDGQITKADRKKQFNQLFSLGFALYFPTKIKTLD